jgi:putative Mg2+ transporter-C (MgtC) family protein
MEWIVDLELLLRLVLAAALGYLIGLERRWAGHSAGNRTFALCAMGSALFAVISEKAFPSGDPGRVAAGVVTGLGFLGAGMILKGADNEVKGLTTAAGIWTVGGVGLAAGTGEYILAIGAAILTTLLLTSERLLHIEEYIDRKRGKR